MLHGGGTMVLGQVLSGMGGVGKTQLAADHARSAFDSGGLDVLVWVAAGSRADVVDGYARAGVELCHGDPDNADDAAKTFLSWLASHPATRPCRWMVVLDDINDPDDLKGLWPPAGPHGWVLATTRRRDAALLGEGRRRIDIGLFTDNEATAYLTDALAAHGRTEPVEDLAALAADLGHLPLALSQAAAYLADTDITPAQYRALLVDRTTTLAHSAPDRLPDDQTHTVAACWSLSVERADTLAPVGLARPMLQLAAVLDPNGIPAAVLTGEPACVYLAAHRLSGPAPAARRPEPVSASDADRALRALDRLSLINHHRDTPHHAVRVHQLVQRAIRETLTPTEHEQTAEAAADALLAAWPDVERDAALAQVLRANTTALTGCADDALHRPDAHTVLFRAGASLGDCGQAAAAAAYFRRLTDTTARRLGPDHPDTVASRHELARWRGMGGDPAGAADAFAEVLADMERVLGPDHPHTLATRHEYARWRGEAGDPARAAEATAEVLADRLRVLGPDHPQTLATRHEHARWRGEAGDPAQAADIFADVLADRLRVLGPDHPHTLATRHEYGRWRGEAGDPTGAAEAFADLLADRLRVLGPDHPRTLTTRHEHARWRGEAGDPTGAAEATADLLADMERVLGPDHPRTLTTRHEHARWRGEAGDPAQAADIFADVLADRLRVLGPDHPHTLATRSQLSYWQGEAEGRPFRAP
ncbi:FxSxx-COOH system tetratricopeptide repeat protein [Streptomyces sp. NPDC057705]|uniref:FxSxx-COOH system tetratricopeptide repeat protein n=1 Tax=Streptomyces sp. NPDC057705 TaxID=3346222 RepID=UPI00367E7624